MVELKVPGLKPTGMEQRAVEIVRRHGAQRDVVLSSFNPVVLYRLKRLDPQVRTALIFMDTNWNPELVAEIKPGDLVNLPWPLRQEFIRRAVRKIVRPDLLSINHQVDEAVIDRLIAKGWPSFIWTPDEEGDIRRALAKRPYGVISDQPIRARQLRGQ
jgi:glycerophosphoryl diester phosphodiesterase